MRKTDKRTMITVRLPNGIMKRVRDFADESGYTLTQAIIILLLKGFENATN